MPVTRNIKYDSKKPKTMSSDKQSIPVLVAGALGRMGSEVIKAINSSNDYELVGAIDNLKEKEGQDIGSLLGLGTLNVFVSSDFEASLCAASQNSQKNGTNQGVVLVDFTHPKVAYKHTRTAIAYGVHPVIGTTGITSDQLDDLSKFSEKACIGSAIIPNFSVGMVLLQQAAAAAACCSKTIPTEKFGIIAEPIQAFSENLERSSSSSEVMPVVPITGCIP